MRQAGVILEPDRRGVYYRSYYTGPTGTINIHIHL